MKFQINETNFHIASTATFTSHNVPTREHDFISGRGQNQSRYWFEKDGVIRESNHWGDVAHCKWLFLSDKKVHYFTRDGSNCKFTKAPVCGFCKFENFIQKTLNWPEFEKIFKYFSDKNNQAALDYLESLRIVFFTQNR